MSPVYPPPIYLTCPNKPEKRFFSFSKDRSKSWGLLSAEAVKPDLYKPRLGTKSYFLYYRFSFFLVGAGDGRGKYMPLAASSYWRPQPKTSVITISWVAVDDIVGNNRKMLCVFQRFPRCVCACRPMAVCDAHGSLS